MRHVEASLGQHLCKHLDRARASNRGGGRERQVVPQPVGVGVHGGVDGAGAGAVVGQRRARDRISCSECCQKPVPRLNVPRRKLFGVRGKTTRVGDNGAQEQSRRLGTGIFRLREELKQFRHEGRRRSCIGGGASEFPSEFPEQRRRLGTGLSRIWEELQKFGHEGGCGACRRVDRSHVLRDGVGVRAAVRMVVDNAHDARSEPFSHRAIQLVVVREHQFERLLRSSPHRPPRGSPVCVPPLANHSVRELVPEEELGGRALAVQLERAVLEERRRILAQPEFSTRERNHGYDQGSRGRSLCGSVAAKGHDDGRDDRVEVARHVTHDQRRPGVGRLVGCRGGRGGAREQPGLGLDEVVLQGRHWRAWWRARLPRAEAERGGLA
mmetsp:Transcript_32318/g.80458  ORF Transcript_32318/g.80458 Transcript_32318/m.80458 type:complete len:382 (+) Transcript_32318:656-1801(+)